MEAKEIALEIIKIAKNEETIEVSLFDDKKNSEIIKSIESIVGTIEAKIEKNKNCAGCVDRDCLDSYIKISLYALKQVNLVRNATSNNNGNEENNELSQKIYNQIDNFEKISNKLAEIDFGIHSSTENCSTS